MTSLVDEESATDKGLQSGSYCWTHEAILVDPAVCDAVLKELHIYFETANADTLQAALQPFVDAFNERARSADTELNGAHVAEVLRNSRAALAKAIGNTDVSGVVVESAPSLDYPGAIEEALTELEVLASANREKMVKVSRDSWEDLTRTVERFHRLETAGGPSIILGHQVLQIYHATLQVLSHRSTQIGIPSDCPLVDYWDEDGEVERPIHAWHLMERIVRLVAGPWPERIGLEYRASSLPEYREFMAGNAESVEFWHPPYITESSDEVQYAIDAYPDPMLWSNPLLTFESRPFIPELSTWHPSLRCYYAQAPTFGVGVYGGAPSLAVGQSLVQEATRIRSLLERRAQVYPPDTIDRVLPFVQQCAEVGAEGRGCIAYVQLVPIPAELREYGFVPEWEDY